MLDGIFDYLLRSYTNFTIKIILFLPQTKFTDSVLFAVREKNLCATDYPYGYINPYPSVISNRRRHSRLERADPGPDRRRELLNQSDARNPYLEERLNGRNLFLYISDSTKCKPPVQINSISTDPSYGTLERRKA